nr:zinc knuckle CX2CX4HX4C [Tanacetum cinerariifolium]
MIANMDAYDDVVLKEAKDVDVDIVKDVQDANEEETKPTKLQKVVDVVTIAKIITEVVTAASTTIIAADVLIHAATTAAASILNAAPSRRRKGVVIRDPKESTTTSIIIHSKSKSKDKGKGILVNDVTRLQTLVDKKKVVITEALIRDALRLDDAEYIEYLPNEEIFPELARMGFEKPSTKLTFYKAFFSSKWKFLIHTILQCISAKRTSWNEFSSSMASAIICLSSGRKFNFSKVMEKHGLSKREGLGEVPATRVNLVEFGVMGDGSPKVSNISPLVSPSTTINMPRGLYSIDVAATFEVPLTTIGDLHKLINDIKAGKHEAGLVDVITIGIPSLSGDGFTKETIHVEYEWRSPRCDICKIFGHVHDHYPKMVVGPPIVTTSNYILDLGMHRLGKEVDRLSQVPEVSVDPLLLIIIRELLDCTLTVLARDYSCISGSYSRLCHPSSIVTEYILDLGMHRLGKEVDRLSQDEAVEETLNQDRRGDDVKAIT